jgi:hypothetical protein
VSNMLEAWHLFCAHKGLLSRNALNRGPLSRNALGQACAPEQQRDMGYWPYPWIEMPPGGEPFDEFASIVTPNANGTETLVLTFTIPYAYDGIVLGVFNGFTGPGFVEGSGNLIWRIRLGQASLLGKPVRNYNNIRVTLGSLAQARSVQGGILVQSGQIVQYSVTHAIGSPIVPAGTRIICNITGFYWPRGSTPMQYVST